MKILAKVSLNLLVLCLHLVANCQNDTTLTLVKSELNFPTQILESEFVLASPIFIEDTSQTSYVLPDIDGKKQIYKFGLDILLPQDKGIQATFNNRQKEFNLCLIQKAASSNIFFLLIDENANKNFLDEVVDTIAVGLPAYKKLNLLIDSLADLRFSIPLQIEINRLGGQIEISCKNLTKYELVYPLEDTIIRLNLLTNFWYVNFKIRDVSLKDNKVKIQNIRLNEPFFFNGKLRILNNLDLLEGRVEFRTLRSDEVPFGYREGYYLDMERLKSFSDSYLTSSSSCSVSWIRPKYFLLYFWGNWCFPCMNRIEEIKRLSENLQAKDEIALLSYPTIFKEKDTLEWRCCMNQSLTFNLL
jgi:thiol-disulfide isomerase/thioredoxin